MANLYSMFLARGDLCFDVGANVGDRVAVMRSVGARVVAVEPQPACARTIRGRFAADAEVTVVESGLAAADGVRVLQQAEESTLASMSEEWIDSVSASGRFADQSWEEGVEVEVTTLEALIAEHGRPRFCKIDVEGYESEVLLGLATPIEALSFEYAHEARGNAFKCIERLEELGAYLFCFSAGESMSLASGWHSGAEQRSRLEALEDPLSWGDVYARTARA